MSARGREPSTTSPRSTTLSGRSRFGRPRSLNFRTMRATRSPEKYGRIDALDRAAGTVVDAGHVAAARAEVALHRLAQLLLAALLRGLRLGLRRGPAAQDAPDQRQLPEEELHGTRRHLEAVVAHERLHVDRAVGARRLAERAAGARLGVDVHPAAAVAADRAELAREHAVGDAAVVATRSEQEVAVLDAALADARDAVLVRLDAALDAHVAARALGHVDDERLARLDDLVLGADLAGPRARRGLLVGEELRLVDAAHALEHRRLHVGQFVEERQERRLRDLHEVHAVDGRDRGAARLVLDERDLAEERVLAEPRDDLLAARDLGVAGAHEEERVAGLALRDDRRALLGDDELRHVGDPLEHALLDPAEERHRREMVRQRAVLVRLVDHLLEAGDLLVDVDLHDSVPRDG